MPNLRHISIVGLWLSVILTACSSATPISPTQISIPITPQLTLPPPIPIATPEPVAVGVPMIDYRNEKSELIVVSSVTGKLFEAFTPIPLGNNYNYVFAPDGRTLALVSDGQLYLIDLPSWKYRTSDVGLHGWLSAVVYNPGGTLLAVASGLSGGGLRIVDAKSGQVQASAQADFSIRNVKFTSDGKALMVYAPQLAPTSASVCPKPCYLPSQI